MISILITLVVIGFCLWLVLTYIPLAEPFRSVIIGVAVLGVVLWLLSAFGVAGVPHFNMR